MAIEIGIAVIAILFLAVAWQCITDKQIKDLQDRAREHERRIEELEGGMKAEITKLKSQLSYEYDISIGVKPEDAGE